jgi:hypothetical protein
VGVYEGLKINNILDDRILLIICANKGGGEDKPRPRDWQFFNAAMQKFGGV